MTQELLGVDTEQTSLTKLDPELRQRRQDRGRRWRIESEPAIVTVEMVLMSVVLALAVHFAAVVAMHAECWAEQSIPQS